MKTKRTPGFADILLYQTLISEGVIEMKNGSLLAGWWMEGPDLESATKEEVEALSAYINRALLRFGRGWMLHVEMVRKPAEGYLTGCFKEPTNLLIDLERHFHYRREGGHYETRIALFITYLPPLLEQSSRAKRCADFLLGRGGTEEEYRETGEKHLKDFEDKLSAVAWILMIKLI